MEEIAKNMKNSFMAQIPKKKLIGEHEWILVDATDDFKQAHKNADAIRRTEKVAKSGRDVKVIKITLCNYTMFGVYRRRF